MSPPPAGLPKSPEAANALRLEQERNAAKDALYTDPKYVTERKAELLKNSPFGNFEAPKNPENTDPDGSKTVKLESLGDIAGELSNYSEETPGDTGDQEPDIDLEAAYGHGNENEREKNVPQIESAEDIRARIAARSGNISHEGRENDGNIEVLDSTQAREKNTTNAQNLFFSPDNLTAQCQILSNGNTREEKALIDWTQANLGEGGPLEDSFQRIQASFVMPKGLEGNSINEIYNSNPDRITELSDALSDAMKLEVSRISEGKPNTDPVAVDMLTKEMCKPENTPLKRLQIFAEINNHIQGREGRGGAQLAKAFKKGLTQREANRAQEVAFHDNQATEIQRRNNEKKPKAEEEVKPQEAPQTGGDVFTASTIDTEAAGRKGSNEST